MYQETEDLLKEIGERKTKLYDSAREKGLTNEDTIRYSQELDQLIYQYQRRTLRDRNRYEEKKSVLQQMMCMLPTIFVEV